MHAEEWIAKHGNRLRSIGASRLRRELGRAKFECTWCGGQVPKRRKTWCSQACIDAFLAIRPAEVRRVVAARDRGVCQLCGRDTVRIRALLARLWQFGAARRSGWADTFRFYAARLRQLGFYGKNGRPLWLTDLWENDHILSVCDGGGLRDSSNFRALCVPCHKTRTAEDNRRRTQQSKRHPNAKKGKPLAIAGKDSQARKWLDQHREAFRTLDGLPDDDVRAQLYDQIGSGRHVAIVTAHEKIVVGRAVMRGPTGWVLNCGGQNGTPAIADERNTVYVSGAKLNEF